MRVSPEQLRNALADMFRDPETRGLIFPHLVVSGGTCTSPLDVGPGGQFGTNCSGSQDYSFPGKLGIGTTSPQNNLQVLGGAIFAGAAGQPGSGAAAKGVYLSGPDYDGNHFMGGTVGLSAWFDGTNYKTGTDGGSNGGAIIQAASSSDELRFYTIPVTGTSQQTITPANLGTYLRMVILSGGNVGIGTGNPTQKLDVAGSIALGYNLKATNQLLKTFATFHDAGNVPSELDVVMFDGGQAGMLIKNVRDGSYNSQSLEFCTHHGGVSQGTRVTIDKDGNAGIGTTTPKGRLEVQARSSFSATGTVTIASGSLSTVTGSGTLFTTELNVGDRITIGSHTRIVHAIQSNTSLTVNADFPAAVTTGTTMTVFPAALRTFNSSGSPKLVVSDEGDVGIGGKGPKGKLSIEQVFSSTPPVKAGQLESVVFVYVEGGIGNNTDFWGEQGMYLTARDHANVTTSNKGVLYGLNIDMYPKVHRLNPPADDVAALVIQNSGQGSGTDAIFVGDGQNVLNDATPPVAAPGTPEWDNIMKIEADAFNGIAFVTPPERATTPSIKYAVKLDELLLRSGGAGILLRNNMPIASQRAGTGTPTERQVSILILDSRDVLVHSAGESSTAGHEFLLKDGTKLAVFDSAIAADETSLLIRRNVGGTYSLQRVSMGAADSGGTNFRLLRVPN